AAAAVHDHQARHDDPLAARAAHSPCRPVSVPGVGNQAERGRCQPDGDTARRSIRRTPVMKIIHTSDWHVGRTLRGRSRADEHEAVLAEVARLARSENAALVLVTGDLFDTAAPAADAERIVYQALLDLAATGATVVVLAGNHDNERRLQAVEPL